MLVRRTVTAVENIAHDMARSPQLAMYSGDMAIYARALKQFEDLIEGDMNNRVISKITDIRGKHMGRAGC